MQVFCSDVYITTNSFNSLIVKLLLDARVSVKIPPDRKEVIGATYIGWKKCLPDFCIPSHKLFNCFCLGGVIQKGKKNCKAWLLKYI